MALKINTNQAAPNPYLSQRYAQYNLNEQQLPKSPNNLRNALNSYQFHLQRRRQLAQRRSYE